MSRKAFGKDPRLHMFSTVFLDTPSIWAAMLALSRLWLSVKSCILCEIYTHETGGQLHFAEIVEIVDNYLAHPAQCATLAQVPALGTIIKLRRKQKGWNQKDLGERVGMAGTTISRKELGQIEINDADLILFAKALGTTPEDLRAEARLTRVPQTSGAGRGKIPLINRVRAGNSDVRFEYGPDSGQGGDYLDRGFWADDPHAFALRIEGDSMAPALLPGDIVVVRPLDPQAGNIRLSDDDVVYVLFTEESDFRGECMIARFTEVNGEYLFRKDNRRYRTVRCHREDIQQLGKVVERRTKLV